MKQILEKLRDQIDAERATLIGDGYNYTSGEEYGMRRAMRLVDKAISVLPPQPDAKPVAYTKAREQMLDGWGESNGVLTDIEVEIAGAIVCAGGPNCQKGIDHLSRALDLLKSLKQPAEQAGGLTEETGLPIEQEPKYTTNGRAIVNRASGEEIPANEPIFIFRARDIHARAALLEYLLTIPVGNHYEVVAERIEDFDKFRSQYPERMKVPDTDTMAKKAGA